MSDPIIFDSAAPRFGLPLLYAGQAQKEAFVNEAHALADALLHCAIEGTAAAPPASPVNGTNWLVASGASGDWAGHEGKLACRQGGNWIFVNPRDGMRVLDRSAAQETRFSGTWRAPVAPVQPSGGSVVDSGARAVINTMIAVLRTAGILPDT